MSLEAVIEKVGPLEQGKQLQIAKLSIEELKLGLVISRKVSSRCLKFCWQTQITVTDGVLENCQKSEETSNETNKMARARRREAGKATWKAKES